MFLIFGVLFLLLIGRIAYIQAVGVVNGHELAVEAANRYQRQTSLTADRGKILDRNGEVIAEDTLSYKLVAVVSPSATTNAKNPHHVIDPASTAVALSEIIDMDEKRIYEILTRDDDPYQVEFGTAGRGLSYDQKKALDALELPGIVITSEKKRFYPNGSFASYLIGFAQRTTDEDGNVSTIGKMGLEKTYDKQLTGIDGAINYDADVKGYLLPNSEKMVQAAQDGSDIYLTLDKTIQNFLEDALTKVYDKYSPESMIGIVANPKTGEILAMSQRPTFDPMTREGLDASWLNEAVEDVIEPGSTMKTFTVAAAVETNNWYPNLTYQSGSYTLLDKTIRDHNDVGWGKITYLEGFQRSSNTAMANLLEIMGRDTLIDYLGKFGFGQKTGIDLPKEVAGTILSKVPANILTTSYGQGSTVTPIQLIQAFTSIANGGQMMQPYVIERIENSNTGAIELQSEPKVKGKPISSKTAEQMRQLLASTVTSDAGTATKFALDGYDVGGKTGTAQMPDPNSKTGQYAKGKNEYLYSFLGMAPVDDPQFIMYIAVAKPKLGVAETGSDPTSQVFKSVMQNSLMYYNIEPENTADISYTEIANYQGETSDSVSIELSNAGVDTVVIGDSGVISAQYPSKGTKLMKGNIIFLKTDGAITLPDFTGWSLRNVLVYKQLSGLPIEVVGEGYVVNQSVSAQTTVSDNSPIVVKLQTPQEQFNSPPTQGETEN